MTLAELLQQARAAEKLSALDRRFGAAVARWSDASLEDASLIEFAAAVASCQLARQQVFVDLERLADEDPLALGDAALYPSAASLTAAGLESNSARRVARDSSRGPRAPPE